jgi:hypothetical protein
MKSSTAVTPGATGNTNDFVNNIKKLKIKPLSTLDLS